MNTTEYLNTLPRTQCHWCLLFYPPTHKAECPVDAAASHVQRCAKSGLVQLRATLEEARYASNVASGYRGAPAASPIDEIVEELDSDNLAAVARMPQLPVDEAVQAWLAGVRGRMCSANLPPDILVRFDKFADDIMGIARASQSERVARYKAAQSEGLKACLIMAVVGGGLLYGAYRLAEYGLSEDQDLSTSMVIMAALVGVPCLLVLFFVAFLWFRDLRFRGRDGGALSTSMRSPSTEPLSLNPSLEEDGTNTCMKAAAKAVQVTIGGVVCLSILWGIAALLGAILEACLDL